MNTPHTPVQHLRLALFGVVARITEQCTEGAVPEALARFPVLADYRDAMRTDLPAPTAQSWQQALIAWEQQSPQGLPLRSLLDAGLSRLQIELLLAAGLVEEDPRISQTFPADKRPSFALLLAWWRAGADGSDRAEDVRIALLDLLARGLLQAQNPEAPRPDWLLSVPHPIWDGLRGDAPKLHWLTHRPASKLCPLSGYLAAPGLQSQCAALPALLRQDPGQVLIVRGPAHNGRRTLIGAIAHALGKSLLIADGAVFEDEARWRLFGALAVLLDAMPAIHAELAPGETRPLPALPWAAAPLAVASSRHGAWACADSRPMLTIDLPLPDQHQRALHWQAVAPGAALAAGMRLTSGNLRRAARTASSHAALEQRTEPTQEDAQKACRTLQSARLETLAARLPAQGGLHELAVDTPTRDELEALAARCRFREQLAAASGSHGNAGVRALFAGSSGTGKTLAARLLAATLGKDLYRVDLSATVNKYIGETEKNLDRAFAAAEELDVVLLLDEGDALMANRTDVGSSNDRYANLETNFLLQRIESFDGILLVTSNAADRIDKAFSRRMDVVIHFRPPDEWRRHEILKLHLAAEDIDDGWLQQMACRCALTGGQLRNIVGHARLLALQEGGAMRVDHLYAALCREYRRTGGTCPLRPSDATRPVPAR